METQIRRYRIADGKLDDFVAAWVESVVPLRESFGFRIEGAWKIPESNEFVWLVSYEGEETFAEADARYYATTARKQVQPDPATWIEGGHHTAAIGVV